MNKHWVAAWATAPASAEHNPAQYGRNITLRYVLKTSIGGEAVRLHFSNAYAAEKVVLDRVTVTLNGVTQNVLFGGEPACRMEAHGSAVSDALPLEVKAGDDVGVSLYMKDFTALHTAVAMQGPFTRGSVAEGDRCDEAEFSLRWNRLTDWFYFLTEMDVLADEKAHALVAYGDSITSQAWPDHLIQRLLDAGRTDLAVVRRAISGSRILGDYTNLQYLNYGESGFKRFEREVCTVPGAEAVVILHGINDIIHPDGQHPCRPWSNMPTLEGLIEGMRFYIGLARKYGLRVYLATLTPVGGWRTDNPDRQALRAAFNEWIRTTDEADGVVDFDLATRDPENPQRLLPICDSGDHLHPALGEGAKRMADCVPDEVIR